MFDIAAKYQPQSLNNFSETPVHRKEKEHDDVVSAKLFRLVQSSTHNNIYPKLEVSQPGDESEKEADRMADTVMRMEDKEGIQKKEDEEQIAKKEDDNEIVSRKCEHCEKEESVYKKNEDEQVSKKDDDEIIKKKCDKCEKEDKVHRKESGSASKTPVNFNSALNSGKGSGSPLSSNTQTFMESGFSHDFSNVKIHTDSTAVQLSKDVNAQAFTHGSDIYFNSGKYNPESNSGKHLLAHELTHVVQQGKSVKLKHKNETNGNLTNTTVVSTKANDNSMNSVTTNLAIQTELNEFSDDKERIDRGILDDIGSAVGSATDAVGSAAGAAWDATGGKVVGAVADFAWSMIDEYAPSLAPILREISAKGILGFLKDKITGAIAGIFAGLTGNSEAVDSLISTYTGLFKRVQTIIIALASGDCGPLFTAIEEFKNLISEAAGEVWNKITEFFQPIGDFFSNIWNSFGAPLVDWISKLAGDAWTFIQSLGQQIWDFTQPIRDAFGEAWDWIKDMIGIGASAAAESGGGIVDWVMGKATEVWESVKGFLQPVIAPIQSVIEKVASIINLDAILNLRDTVANFVSNIANTANTMGQGEGVAEQQTSLRDEILPAVLNSIEGLRGNLIGAGEWVSSKIGDFGSVVQSFMDGVNSVDFLQPVTSYINWLPEKVLSLTSWAQGTVVSVFTFIGDGLVKVSKFIKPVLDALQKIIDVLGNLLGKLPDFLMGPVWWILPACIKDPIKDFFINTILKNIPIVGDIIEQAPKIWAKMKSTALKILKQIFVDGNLLGALWTYFSFLLEAFGIPPKLVVSIIAKAATAFVEIITNPIGFMINLMKALKDGFMNFFSNFGKHMLDGVVDWLFGAVSEAGITIPKDFSFASIFNFILEILDITMERVFERMEKNSRIGTEVVKKLRQAVKFLTGAWEWVSVLINEGPSGLWRFVKDKLSDLWQTVLQSVISWITEKIIVQATVWLASLIDISGIMPVVNTCIAIYRAIESFMQYLKQMLEIIDTVLDGIIDIAKGVTGKAAESVEKALAKSLPIIIGFLANQFGFGNLGKKIKTIVDNIRAKIDIAIDKLIDAGLSVLDTVISGVKAAGTAVKEGVQSLIEWWKNKKTFKADDGQEHSILFEGSETNALLYVQSKKTLYSDFINSIKSTPENETYLSEAKKLTLEIDKVRNDNSKTADEKNILLDPLMENLKKQTIHLFGSIPETGIIIPGGQTSADFAKSMSVKPLTIKGTAGTDPTKSAHKVYDQLNNRRTDSGSFFYIRGHLLNQNLHGPGKWTNMTPLSIYGNNEHESKVESKIKTAVNSGAIVEYSVTANYPGTRSDKKSLIDKINKSSDSLISKTYKEQIIEAEDFVPLSLTCKAVSLDETLTPNKDLGLNVDETVNNDIERDVSKYFLDAIPKPDPVKLSTATKDELMTIEGFGDVLATQFIEDRDAYFKKNKITRFSTYDIIAANVRGIGKARLEKLESEGFVSLW